MAKAPLFLVVALSGRALAAAARRAGCGALVLDLFGDVDMRAHALASLVVRGNVAQGFEAEALLEAAERLAPVGRGREQGLVYGAGFEAQPTLLAELSRGRRLLGNAPETLARVKDPAAFFGLLDRLGLPHPEISLERPPDVTNWLSKRVGASGGGHIRPAVSDEKVPERYYQRWAGGRALSALFLANGQAARLLGFSEQWASPDGAAQPYRFGGAVCPARVASTLARDLAAAIDGLVREIGLVGLNSLDVIAAEDDGFAILEVNPRPGATLDIFDGTGAAAGLFGLHAAACEGRLPEPCRMPAVAKAAMIVYADRRLTVPAGFPWPDAAADRSEAGTIIEQDGPVCTILVQAASPDAARARATAQGDAVLSMLRGWQEGREGS